MCTQTATCLHKTRLLLTAHPCWLCRSILAATPLLSCWYCFGSSAKSVLGAHALAVLLVPLGQQLLQDACSHTLVQACLQGVCLAQQVLSLALVLCDLRGQRLHKPAHKHTSPGEQSSGRVAFAWAACNCWQQERKHLCNVCASFQQLHGGTALPHAVPTVCCTVVQQSHLHSRLRATSSDFVVRPAVCMPTASCSGLAALPAQPPAHWPRSATQ
mgnify:CR=1 FL=1